MMIHNEPGPALSRHIGPNTLHEDANAKTGLRQKLQMDSRPSEPRQNAAHVDLAGFGERQNLCRPPPCCLCRSNETDAARICRQHAAQSASRRSALVALLPALRRAKAYHPD